MCTIDSIKLQVMVFSWLKLVIAIYIFATGIIFSSSTDLQQAFGLQFVQYGISLIFLALLSAGVVFPHKYAVNRHNRFLLALAFVFDTIVFAELINYSLIVASYMEPEFPKELQLDCLLNKPQVYSQDECSLFYNSDRTAGMRLLWAYYFTDRNNKASFQTLSSFGGGLCCGFFQPYNCKENTDKFPDTRLQAGISSDLLQQRVTCGPFENYYPAQTNCIDYKDFAADPPIVGGCQHDLGVGFCLDPEVGERSRGCASEVEDYAVALIEPHTVMLMASSMVSLLFMTYSCCMWWKRKEADLFPAFATDVKVNQQYRFVKDQFEVVPKKDLLILEGFVPPPEGHELELADLTALESTPRSGAGTGARTGAAGVAADAKGPAVVAVHKKPAQTAPSRTGGKGKVHPTGLEDEV